MKVNKKLKGILVSILAKVRQGKFLLRKQEIQRIKNQLWKILYSSSKNRKKMGRLKK